jgi:hypothetical protein
VVFIVLLICIFLMMNDVKNIFMCLLVTHTASSVKCLFESLVIFFIELSFYWPMEVIF